MPLQPGKNLNVIFDPILGFRNPYKTGTSFRSLTAQPRPRGAVTWCIWTKPKKNGCITNFVSRNISV